jgi:polyhydroxybutyrate depolymerase
VRPKRGPRVTAHVMRHLVALLFIVSIATAKDLTRHEMMVDGVSRELLLHVPETATTKPAPVIFGFHGHGGTMGKVARSYHFHELWPEAIVIYPQGLNTPGRLTDPEGKKPGWQSGPDDQSNRDLKFFDAMMKTLRERYKVDERRIYATGHSNGGGFTYLLWAERSELFTAMAPSGSSASRSMAKLKPKPALHIAGENDPLVKYAWQTVMIEHVKKLNGCGKGQPWELDAHCTLFPSATGTPFITAIHAEGHKYPKQAPEVIVKFFKSQVKPAP